ncbi:transaldolase [Streptomyces sp. NPDC057616]|uniref:transaldolase n=1 Tax=Streptomyces sp. NPDC057616 TaxID=3346183 RepID=UPI00367EB2DB
MTPSTVSDPLADLSAAGVSIWLDDLSRELLADGELGKLIAGRHVVGVTTNPTIFASALSRGDRYTEQLRSLRAQGASADDALLALTTDDVRAACRVFAPIHERTNGLDGRVSIEVDPRLAKDADATVEQAVKLWEEVGEPNLFVKIPATREGLTAITEVVARGISVNVTLIFSLDRYRAVMDAHAAGLERALRAGHDLAAIHSVASFFVSRVDAEVDRRLDVIATPEALALKGRAAVANARLAYQAYEMAAMEPLRQRLAEAGARPQRPLWASTGVKNPDYPDTMYVSELAMAGTVNTMPGSTLAAFADHGTSSLHPPTAEDHAATLEHFAALERVGVDFADVTDGLEREGLAKFEKSWAELSATVSREMSPESGAEGDADRASAEAAGRAPSGAELLAIYLNDHLAGATGGVQLARRAARAQRGEPELAELARQLEQDRQSPLRIMEDLAISTDRPKVALGRLAEKAGRLKPNGRLFSRSPVSDVLELESLLIGVTAKAACWRTLRALAETDERLHADHLDFLSERADSQTALLEQLRVAAAARAVGHPVQSATDGSVVRRR